jgi:meiotically up-regulated gene 157 (Mug157) protein
VKNDTGSAITAANKFCEFSTTSARDFGGRVGTFPADTAGAVVKPLDDAYAAGYSIPANDMFYVVEDGLCDVLAEATYNLTAGDPVATDAAGLVNGAQAAAGEYIVGRIDVSGTTGSVNVLVHVAAGLAVGGDLSA